MTKSTCAAEGCEKRHHSHGYCNVHTQRVRKNGTYEPTPRVLRSRAIDALWLRLRSPAALADGECWTWPASVNAAGYGTTKRNGQSLASRAAWVEAFGPIPEGMSVCHACDNPPCCRPSHLFIGTAADNTRDMCEKGRNVVVRDLRHGRTKVALVGIELLRAEWAAGSTQKALAAKYGLHSSYVSRIVNGERRTA